MSERKVLSKYYPPDFDPSKIVRQRGAKGGKPVLPTVRLMAPFSMQCTSCGEFIYKGRKFNARKETTEEKYLGISIIRFYIRCTRCSSEITFKTDPQHTDYAAERGCKRNYEPWRESKLAEPNPLDYEEEEEAVDKMKDLEERTLQQQNEMRINDALDEIRARNARIESGKDRAVVPAEPPQHQKEDEEDARIAREAFKMRVQNGDDQIVEEEPTPPPATSFVRPKAKKKDATAMLGLKKRSTEPTVAPSGPNSGNVPQKPVVQPPVSLLSGYDDDSG
ncbi:DUF572-domain-containing protein [Westerdykella ornata]|uniref:Splicing factor YJU2 n=1 Tax=Westerdykella ornata TaxID=318751 RepID=A0A6A6J8V6_WESOR|nr:DUF572-domain-containing protein [Westerdykella ornata]KAF2272634.1 DUF572-domain-containing protein [Westerdykella ornata]